MNSKGEHSLSIETLLEANRWGVFPYPGEDDASFYRRLDYLLSKNGHAIIPEGIEEIYHLGDFPEAQAAVESLYGISPDWVPIFFSNRALTFLHGGCTWFVPVGDGVTVPVIQLKQRLQTQKSILWGLYTRTEILVHELTHAARTGFDSRYEELLAYRSSEHVIRRWIAAGTEIWEGIACLLLLAFWFFLPFTDLRAPLVFIHPLIPLWIISYFILATALRSWRKIHTINRAHQTLKALFTPSIDSSQKTTTSPDARAWALLFRLSDLEIEQFARWSTASIDAYCIAASTEKLRWRLFRAAYWVEEF